METKTHEGAHVEERDFVVVRATGDAAPERRDLIRWGPIIGGLVTTLATMIFLTVLGVAIGLSAFEPNDGGGSTYTTAAAIWGAATAVIAFFVGGFVAAKTTAPGGVAVGALNGFLVAAAAIALTLWLVGSGVGNLLGAAAANFREIASVSFSPDPSSAYDEATTGAWATMITLLVAFAAGAGGGALGHRERRERS